MKYSVYLLLHLVGVVIFMGGNIASIFVKQRADRSRDPGIINHTFTMLNLYDNRIAPVSVLLIVVGGFGLVATMKLSLVGTGWVLWGLCLLVVAMLIYIVLALPIQRKLQRMTHTDSTATFDWKTYDHLSRRWSRLAWTTFVLLTVTFVLMIFKPALPAP